MTTTGRWTGFLVVAALLGAAVYFVTKIMTPASPLLGRPSYDVYSYAFPVLLTAVDAIRNGGQGLFWSPLHDCGQPFLGSGTTGVLYPPFLFALFLSGNNALNALLIFNAAVGGIGAYLLCRELGVGRIAALCGGLAFACSNSATDVLGSTPLVSGPYAWMPAAMLCCERLLRAPSLRAGALLGVVLTIALLPGHPQILLYIYQLVALRVAFEMITRRSFLGMRTLGPLVLGLALPPFLGAVHLLPAMEVMRASIRGVELKATEIETPDTVIDWAMMLSRFAMRSELFNPFLIVPMMLASAALCTKKLGRQVLFHVVVALVSLDMALGSGGYLFQFYSQLPVVKLFRWPFRYLWIFAFSISVLVAIGVDAIVSAETRSGPWARRLGIVALPAIAVGLLRWSTPNVGGLLGEQYLIPAVLVACAAAAFVPRLRLVSAVALAAAVAFNVLVLRPTPFMSIAADGTGILKANATIFGLLGKVITPQDRIHIVGKHSDLAIGQKSGSLFGIPTLTDYASLPTYRFANYFTMLRDGLPMTDLNSYYYPLTGMLPRTINRRLLSLAAVRYFVTHSEFDEAAMAIRKPMLHLLYRIRTLPARTGSAPAASPVLPVGSGEGSVSLWDNSKSALPRARWVPRVEVEADPDALLRRLAAATDDPLQVALVESPPSSGFFGEQGSTSGAAVEFLRNDPEDIVLQVDAPQRGFVVLADQWFPGWRATVADSPAEILRANYVFRAVEVPAGRSQVKFRYVPDQMRLGLLISAATALALVFALRRSRTVAP